MPAHQPGGWHLDRCGFVCWASLVAWRYAWVPCLWNRRPPGESWSGRLRSVSRPRSRRSRPSACEPSSFLRQGTHAHRVSFVPGRHKSSPCPVARDACHCRRERPPLSSWPLTPVILNEVKDLAPAAEEARTAVPRRSRKVLRCAQNDKEGGPCLRPALARTRRGERSLLCAGSFVARPPGNTKRAPASLAGGRSAGPSRPARSRAGSCAEKGTLHAKPPETPNTRISTNQVRAERALADRIQSATASTRTRCQALFM